MIVYSQNFELIILTRPTVSVIVLISTNCNFIYLRTRPGKVAMISKLADDGVGAETRENLKANNVSGDYVFEIKNAEYAKRPGNEGTSIASGVAVITVETSTGENKISIVAG